MVPRRVIILWLNLQGCPQSPLAAGGQGRRGQGHRGPGQAPRSPAETGMSGGQGPRVTSWWSPSLCHQLWKAALACCPFSSGRPAAETSAGEGVLCSTGAGGGGGLLPGSRGWMVSGWRSQGPPLPKVRGTQVRVPKCSRAPLPWPGEGRRAVGAGGQAAGPASPSKATGCQVPGSWARWGTRAGYSPRSCCTEPPEMVGSAMCPCSTRSVPSGSFHQLPDRSCAPAVQRMGRQTEKPN